MSKRAREVIVIDDDDDAAAETKRAPIYIDSDTDDGILSVTVIHPQLPLTIADLTDDAFTTIMEQASNESLVYKARSVNENWRRIIDDPLHGHRIWTAHLRRIRSTPGLSHGHAIAIDAALALPQPMTRTRFEATVAATMGMTVMRFIERAMSWDRTFRDATDDEWPEGRFRSHVTLCPLDAVIAGVADAARLTIVGEFAFQREVGLYGRRLRDIFDETEGDVIKLKQWWFVGGSEAVDDILRTRVWTPTRGTGVPRFVRHFMREHGCLLRLGAKGSAHYDDIDRPGYFERLPPRLDGTTHEETQVVTNVPLPNA